MIDADKLLAEPVHEPETKNKRKEKSKVKKIKNEKTVLKFLPFRRLISEECIALDKGVTNFYRIEDASARRGSLQQQQEALDSFLQFLRSIHSDIKFIFTSFPLDMSENIDYAKRRFKMRAVPKSVQNEQKKSLETLEYLDNNRLIDTVYLQVFGEDEESLEEVDQEIRTAQSQNFRVLPMTLAQKIKLLFRRYNPLSPLPLGIPYQQTDKTGRDPVIQKIVDKKGYDPIFIGQIQPLGGIRPCSSKDLQISDGYIRTLNLTVYRPKNNPNFWGERVFLMKNVTTTVDIHTIDISNPMVEQNLNRSLGEYEDRIESSKDKISRKKAIKEYQKLNDTVEHVLDSTELLKEIHVRYILCEPTIEELDAREQEVHRKLKKSQFQASCFLDEHERQFKATFVSHKRGHEFVRRKGKEIKGTALAASYAFNYANHIDPDGLYTGYPLYGSGIVAFNRFHKDNLRKSYSTMIIGSQGFGKTTADKKMAKQAIEMNNNHFGFYMSDETKRLTEYMGGTFLDGRKAVMNPCQIFASEVDAQTKKTLEEESFKTNLVKMRLVFGMASNLPNNSVTMSKAKRYFNEGYLEYIDKNHLDIQRITQYEPEQYPIYGDLLTYIKKRYNEESETFEKKELYKLIESMESFISDAGDIFNQKSVFDFKDKQFVTFDMDKLNKSDTSTYNAQYYNLYTAAFSEAVRVGQREKYLFDRKQKRVDELVYTNITSDEFHNPIRTGNLELINQLDKYSREGRKLLIGQTYIFHDISDAFPDYSSDTGSMGAISTVVSKLFKLSTYRFIFKQDESSRNLLEKVFGAQLSKYDIDDIVKFEERDVLLNIKGAQNIKFQFDLTDIEKKLFDGGL